jgi:hypothetical protein
MCKKTFKKLAVFFVSIVMMSLPTISIFASVSTSTSTNKHTANYNSCPAIVLFDLLAKYTLENNQHRINTVKRYLEELGHMQLSNQEVVEFIQEMHPRERIIYFPNPQHTTFFRQQTHVIVNGNNYDILTITAVPNSERSSLMLVGTGSRNMTIPANQTAGMSRALFATAIGVATTALTGAAAAGVTVFFASIGFGNRLTPSTSILPGTNTVVFAFGLNVRSQFTYVARRGLTPRLCIVTTTVSGSVSATYPIIFMIDGLPVAGTVSTGDLFITGQHVNLPAVDHLNSLALSRYHEIMWSGHNPLMFHTSDIDLRKFNNDLIHSFRIPRPNNPMDVVAWG